MKKIQRDIQGGLVIEKSIRSEVIGVFTYHEVCKVYEQHEGGIHWTLDSRDGCADVHEMIKRAEKLFLCIAEFDKRAKVAIALALIDYKNDFWPEYDADDEKIDWDAVDAGKYDVTTEKFAETITLYDVEIRVNGIYCEYDDGDLFGGHRIHAYFNDHYELLKADV